MPKGETSSTTLPTRNNTPQGSVPPVSVNLLNQSALPSDVLYQIKMHTQHGPEYVDDPSDYVRKFATTTPNLVSDPQ